MKQRKKIVLIRDTKLIQKKSKLNLMIINFFKNSLKFLLKDLT